MNIITTNKTWDAVFPHASSGNLLQLIDGCKQKISKDKINPDHLPCLFLFYGASSENRIAASALAGARVGKQTYRVDLSAIVSKYIGETEKNLNAIFKEAENKNWILFFDEADALFGKRTEIKDSHDKYANQEINYLLQKIETFNDLVIVAVENKEHIPSWLLRKFKQVVHFPHVK